MALSTRVIVNKCDKNHKMTLFFARKPPINVVPELTQDQISIEKMSPDRQVRFMFLRTPFIAMTRRQL